MSLNLRPCLHGPSHLCAFFSCRPLTQVSRLFLLHAVDPGYSPFSFALIRSTSSIFSVARCRPRLLAFFSCMRPTPVTRFFCCTPSTPASRFSLFHPVYPGYSTLATRFSLLHPVDSGYLPPSPPTRFHLLHAAIPTYTLLSLAHRRPHHFDIVAVFGQAHKVAANVTTAVQQ